MPTAKGSFEVRAEREPPYDSADGVSLARASFTKRFQGALEGTSTVQMTAAQTPVQGSAGYVGIERVIGRLDGRSGSFVLQHFGMMTRGQPELIVRVVPDSGTGELSSLTGQMSIEITGGTHSYRFDYDFEA